MASATVLLGSALGAVVAAFYFAIAARLLRRADREEGTSLWWFALFWIGIGTHALVESAWAVGLSFVDLPLSLGIAVLHLKIVTGVAAFLGLVAFVLTVYGQGTRVPLAGAAYAALYAFVVHAYVAREPVGQELRVWYGGLVYANGGGALDLVSVALFLPPLAAAVAYGLLLRVSRDPAQRRRILVTSAAFVAFFGTFLLGWVHEAWYWWGLVERGLALAAAWSVYAVTQPHDRRAERPALGPAAMDA